MRPSSGSMDVELQHTVFCTEFWVRGGLESRCVGRVYGAYGAERAKNTSIKLPSCNKLAFHFIS